MNAEGLLDAIGFIDDMLILEAEEYSGNLKKRERHTRKRILPIAACVCTAFVLITAWIGLGKSFFSFFNAEGSPSEKNDPFAYSVITAPDGGVTIPKTVPQADSSAIADMMGLFLYDGRCYVEYTAFEDAKEEELLGAYLGTVTAGIDEWSGKAEWKDFCGTVVGDIYTVKGMPSSFMLCLKNEVGVGLFINDNGITIQTGADLYSERLDLKDSYTGVWAEAYDDWYYGRNHRIVLLDEHVEASDDHKKTIVDRFIDALNDGRVHSLRDIQKRESGRLYQTQLYALNFTTDHGFRIFLRVFENGLVSFDGVGSVVVQIEERAWRDLIEMIEEVAEN